jgi:glucose-1-phosphate thymidylyltransferase
MPLTGVIVLADQDGHTDHRADGGFAALEHVANRPIAHHVLETLHGAGVTHTLLVGHANPVSRVVQSLGSHAGRLGLSLDCATHEFPLDSAGGLRAAAAVIGSAPCIVHVANGMLDDSVNPLPLQFRAEAPDLVVFVGEAPSASARLSAATEHLLGIGEPDGSREVLGMAGVCLFGEGALMRSADARWRDGDEFDLTDVARRLGAAGGRVHARRAPAWHRYDGDARDLLALNRIALDRIDLGVHQVGSDGNRIEGRVLIHETASITGSVLIGPTVIGPGARISEACIGPYTSIGAGVHIEGAEIERSIIAAGASVLYVGGRLAGSVVGRDARVFRDFSLPRAMKLRVGDGNQVGLC